jgi:hypothetical protein
MKFLSTNLTSVQEGEDIATIPIGLPSDLPIDRIKKIGGLVLLQREVALRHGQLFSLILQCRSAVKAIDVAWIKKASTDRGQTANTISNSKIALLEERRDFVMGEYNRVRNKLVRLGEEYVGGFPKMSRDDLYRKSTVDGRNVGDSRRTDGKFWGDHKAGPSQRATLRQTEDDAVVEDDGLTGMSPHLSLPLELIDPALRICYRHAKT